MSRASEAHVELLRRPRTADPHLPGDQLAEQLCHQEVRTENVSREPNVREP